MMIPHARFFTTLLGATLAFPAPGRAQSFAPPSCGNSMADSTCYTAPKPSNCSSPDAAISGRGACPAGYVGMMDQRGTRNTCTGEATLFPASDESGCTNCGGPLSPAEALNIQRAILEVSESANQAYVNQICHGFSCLDGAPVNDLILGQPIGRIFRDHVWVSQDGFSSGHLPTTNRIKYLSESGGIPANSPAFGFLAKTPGGRPNAASIAQIYTAAKKSAEDLGVTACSGDGKNGCSISCSEPSAGWLGHFCATKTVQYWSCSDSYAVNVGGAWQPTASATVPYTARGDYKKKTWQWPAIFSWNSPSLGVAGGPVYMCNSTINACNGWVTQRSVYKCRVPATYDCSHSGVDASGQPAFFSGTCQTCSPEMGAQWDFELTQANDCPSTPASTRASNSRSVWQTDLIATACPVNGSGTAPTTPSCSGGQILDATGVSCECKPGFSWDGSACLPPPTKSVGALETTAQRLARGRDYGAGKWYQAYVWSAADKGWRPDDDYYGQSVRPAGPIAIAQVLSVNGGAVRDGAFITAVEIAGSLPPGMSASPSGNGTQINLNGTAAANGTFTFDVIVKFAAGRDNAGKPYPEGEARNSVSIVIEGCPAGGASWPDARGLNWCSAAVPNSSEFGLDLRFNRVWPFAPFTVESHDWDNSVHGVSDLMCNAKTGIWESSKSSCIPTHLTCDTAQIPKYLAGETSSPSVPFSLSRTGVVNIGDSVTATWSAYAKTGFADKMSPFREIDYVCKGRSFNAGSCRQVLPTSMISQGYTQEAGLVTCK